LTEDGGENKGRVKRVKEWERGLRRKLNGGLERASVKLMGILSKEGEGLFRNERSRGRYEVRNLLNWGQAWKLKTAKKTGGGKDHLLKTRGEGGW